MDKGNIYLEELSRDPVKFNEEGKPLLLLQEFFKGFPISNLIPYLNSDELLVVKNAIWFVSELGINACSLLKEIIPLLQCNDRYVKYNALEVIRVCSINEDQPFLIHLIVGIEDDDEVIRRLAMRLISNLTNQEIELLITICSHENFNMKHLLGLQRMKYGIAIDSKLVIDMMQDSNPVSRRYGAVIAHRNFDQSPDLLHLATTSNFNEIETYSKQVLYLLSD